jgi:hypothetical protein
MAASQNEAPCGFLDDVHGPFGLVRGSIPANSGVLACFWRTPVIAKVRVLMKDKAAGRMLFSFGRML